MQNTGNTHKAVRLILWSFSCSIMKTRKRVVHRTKKMSQTVYPYELLRDTVWVFPYLVGKVIADTSAWQCFSLIYMQITIADTSCSFLPIGLMITITTIEIMSGLWGNCGPNEMESEVNHRKWFSCCNVTKTTSLCKQPLIHRCLIPCWVFHEVIPKKHF